MGTLQNDGFCKTGLCARRGGACPSRAEKHKNMQKMYGDFVN